MKLLLPNTMALQPELPPGWESITVDADSDIPVEHADADALVLWGASDRHIRSAAESMHKLRFVQALSAGVDQILAAGFGEDVIVASGAGLHSRTVSEHTVALVLALVRRMPEMLTAQSDHNWSTDLGGLQELHPQGRLTTLLDARVLIWGFGEIGQTLAPLLADFGAHVTGVGRSVGDRSGFAVLDNETAMSRLPETDLLISTLPASASTQHLIGESVLAALPNHALVVNVGRGAVVDQDALQHALTTKQIGGAALDVADPEPLPVDSPLWDAPGLILTPHAAGGRPVEADDRIATNLRALEATAQIQHRVER